MDINASVTSTCSASSTEFDKEQEDSEMLHLQLKFIRMLNDCKAMKETALTKTKCLTAQVQQAQNELFNVTQLFNKLHTALKLTDQLDSLEPAVHTLVEYISALQSNTAMVITAYHKCQTHREIPGLSTAVSKKGLDGLLDIVQNCSDLVSKLQAELDPKKPFMRNCLFKRQIVQLQQQLNEQKLRYCRLRDRISRVLYRDSTMLSLVNPKFSFVTSSRYLRLQQSFLDTSDTLIRGASLKMQTHLVSEPVNASKSFFVE